MDPARRAARDALIEKLKGDEDITIETEGATDVNSSGGIAMEGETLYETSDGVYEEGEPEVNGDAPHTHAPQEQAGQGGVPAELVVDILAQRAGQLEKELAVREARILILEAQLRAVHQH